MFIKTINNIKGAKFMKGNDTISILGEKAFIDKIKSTYTKQVYPEYQCQSIIYDKNGDCIGIQLEQTDEIKEEIIVMPKKKICKVILQYGNGKKWIGTAKCHTNDEFLATKGIKIAKSRAIIKRQEFLIEENINKEKEQYYVN